MRPLQVLGVLLMTSNLTGIASAQSRTTRKEARPCVAILEPIPGGSNVVVMSPVFGGKPTIYVSNGVSLRCQGQNITLKSDSLISFDGLETFTLIGNTHYQDDDYEITGDTLSRFKANEQMQLRGNGRIVDRAKGSVLRAPQIDYYRQIPGVNSVERVLAAGGVEVDLVSDQETGDSVVPDSEPWHLVSERLMRVGSNTITAYGNVVLVRDSTRLTADSLKRLTDSAQTIIQAWGAPARIVSLKADSARTEALRFTQHIADNEAVRDLRAEGSASFQDSTIQARSDTILAEFADGKIRRLTLLGNDDDAHFHRDNTQAWGRLLRAEFEDGKIGSLVIHGLDGKAHLTQGGYDAWGDSLVVDTRLGNLSMLRLFQNARLEQPLDSAAPPAADSLGLLRDWISGGNIAVTFDQADSAGTSVTTVALVEAIRSACSFGAEVPRDQLKDRSGAARTISYSCADTIRITMTTGFPRKVEKVEYRGNMRGSVLRPRTEGNAAVGTADSHLKAAMRRNGGLP